MLLWKVKICGVTNSIDAVAAAQAGADAVGLNFHPRSLRSVSLEEADLIVHALPKHIARIGVFVNAQESVINNAVNALQLKAVQLHGDENPDMVSEISCPVIRAIRVFEDRLELAVSEVDRWIEAGVEAILLDAASASEFGGTGKRLNWRSVAELTFDRPIVLAGGLNADNVERAISIARPAAVDVASGIESFPGRKDHPQMRRFVTLARQAFASS